VTFLLAPLNGDELWRSGWTVNGMRIPAEQFVEEFLIGFQPVDDERSRQSGGVV